MSDLIEVTVVSSNRSINTQVEGPSDWPQTKSTSARSSAVKKRGLGLEYRCAAQGSSIGPSCFSHSKTERKQNIELSNKLGIGH